MNIDECMKAVAMAASEDVAFGALDGYVVVPCCKLCNSPHRAGAEASIHKPDCPVSVVAKHVADSETDIHHLRCLVWVLMDKQPCVVVDRKCRTHGFATGFGNLCCPHGTAKYVLPDDFDTGAVAEVEEWIAAVAERKKTEKPSA